MTPMRKKWLPADGSLGEAPEHCSADAGLVQSEQSAVRALHAGAGLPGTIGEGFGKRIAGELRSGASDLYALEEIDAIAGRWRGGLRFVPILSEGHDDPLWTGARGLVTEHIDWSLAPDARVYLCGPPAMIDAAVARLEALGLASAAALVAGGQAITAGVLAVLAIYLLGDAVCGDDTSTPRYRHPAVLTVQLWAALPLLALIVFAAV